MIPLGTVNEGPPLKENVADIVKGSPSSSVKYPLNGIGSVFP